MDTLALSPPWKSKICPQILNSILIPHVYNKNNEYVQQMNNEICQSNIWSNITIIDLYTVDKFYFSTRLIKDIHLMGNN